MAIVFNEATIRTVSKEVLEGPTTLSTLNQNLSTANDGKADALLKDDANKVFYDNYENILIQYHTERHYLNGTIATPYDYNQLLMAAKGQLGAQHFPTSPAWVNFNPKLIDMVQGQPTSYDAANEVEATTDINNAINDLINGFSDGAVTSTIDGGWSGPDFDTDNSGFSAGQRAVVGLDTLVLITGVVANPPGQTLSVTVLAGTNGAPDNAQVKTFRNGFNNSERTGGGTSSPMIMAYFEGFIDAAVAVWDNALAAQLAALNLNDAEGLEAADIATAKVNVNTARAAIAAWQGSSQRFGDTQLGILQAAMTQRTGTEIPARASDIGTYLGSVSQDGTGAFSGSGNYFQFFKWINQRVSRAGGTLTKYYGYDLVVNFSANIKDNKEGQLSEYADNMVVAGLTADPDGTDIIQVLDATDFAVGNSVYVIDDTTTPMYSGSIIGLNGNIVQLSTGITGYLIDKAARLVKVI